jgi:hypothetical protein
MDIIITIFGMIWLAITWVFEAIDWNALWLGGVILFSVYYLAKMVKFVGIKLENYERLLKEIRDNIKQTQGN